MLYGVHHVLVAMQKKPPNNFPEGDYDVDAIRASYPSLDDYVRHRYFVTRQRIRGTNR